MTLADALAAHVRAKYKTQAAAAKALGVSASFISQVLSGSKAPTPAILDDAGIEVFTLWRYSRRRKVQRP